MIIKSLKNVLIMRYRHDLHIKRIKKQFPPRLSMQTCRQTHDNQLKCLLGMFSYWNSAVFSQMLEGTSLEREAHKRTLSSCHLRASFQSLSISWTSEFFTLSNCLQSGDLFLWLPPRRSERRPRRPHIMSKKFLWESSDERGSRV